MLLDEEDQQTIVQQFVDFILANPFHVRLHSASSGYVYVGANVPLHRVLLKLGKGQEGDHRNGDGLDNRRANLRRATSSQNKVNMIARKRNGMSSSRFRGVCLHRSRKGDTTTRWRAHISFENQKKHLGYFKDEEEAARAYDRAAEMLHGEFAILNFPVQRHMLSKHKNVVPIEQKSGKTHA